eukprot:3994073-Amphidinium_carterae.1
MLVAVAASCSGASSSAAACGSGGSACGRIACRTELGIRQVHRSAVWHAQLTTASSSSSSSSSSSCQSKREKHITGNVRIASVGALEVHSVRTGCNVTDTLTESDRPCMIL